MHSFVNSHRSRQKVSQLSAPAKKIKNLISGLQGRRDKVELAWSLLAEVDKSTVTKKLYKYSLSYLTKLIKFYKYLEHCPDSRLSSELIWYANNYENALQAVYHRNSDSYNEILTLERDYEEAIAAKRTQSADVILISIKISSLLVKSYEMILTLIHTKVLDLVDGTDHFSNELIADTLRNQMKLCTMASRLIEIRKHQKQINRENHLLSQTKKPDVITRSTHRLVCSKSGILLDKLRLHFLELEWKADISDFKFGHNEKRQFGNLLTAYRKFHRDYYQDAITPKKEFVVLASLKRAIYEIDCLFEDKKIKGLSDFMWSCTIIDSFEIERPPVPPPHDFDNESEFESSDDEYSDEEFYYPDSFCEESEAKQPNNEQNIHKDELEPISPDLLWSKKIEKTQDIEDATDKAPRPFLAELLSKKLK